MALAKKIILHSPVSDQTLLTDFVERCLRDGVSLLAIIGPGCEDLEETVDWIVVGDGGDPDRYLCTSSHPDESFEDLVNMVEVWEAEQGESYEEIHL